jgi:hypothetical protein
MEQWSPGVHETRGLFACEYSSRRCVPDRTNAVSFFEPPPPPPERIIPEEFEVPEWYGPPEGVLGGVVPLELLLARSDKAAVVIESATVYPAGMEFVIDVRWRERSEEWLWPGGYGRRRKHGGGLPDDLFRAGVQFPDGSKATSLGSGLDMPIAVAHGVEEQGVAAGLVADDEESEEEVVRSGPLLKLRSAGGGGQRYSQSFWLWPLPPEGPLSFVCEWPAFDIGLSRVDVDSALFRDAASRSRPLWDDRAEVAPPGASPAS